ncbi:hypothetical protein C0J52_28099 [Blattella germanica]|nr:hypothetical protein C0J52_28099 [Blattella germanica]
MRLKDGSLDDLEEKRTVASFNVYIHVKRACRFREPASHQRYALPSPIKFHPRSKTLDRLDSVSPTSCESQSDVRFRLTECFMKDEREYGNLLGSAKELYGGPLKKLSCLGDQDHHVLFGGLANLSALSKETCYQVRTMPS